MDQILQTVNNGGEQTTTTEPKNAAPLPTSKRRNKKTEEEKRCQNKELDQAREKTRLNIGVISEVEGAAGFVRTQE